MNKRLKISFFFAAVFVFTQALLAQQADPLPSWNDGPAKAGILEFMRAVTEKNSPDFIEPLERIATFDQDGTILVEQPMYADAQFAYDRIRALAADHPEWQYQFPFNAVLQNNMAALMNLNPEQIKEVHAAANTGMRVEDYQKMVKAWFFSALHPRFKKPYSQLAYKPMVELIQFLQQNQFCVYIVSGAGQEFIRSYSKEVFGVPVNHIVGTIWKTDYGVVNGKPALIKQAGVLLLDIFKGKPESINMFIGAKPNAAFGNSIGDKEMLEWTRSGPGKRLAMLVHHDDAEREYAYDAQSKIGKFSKDLMDEALRSGWIVISMKNDWKVIFADPK